MAPIGRWSIGGPVKDGLLWSDERLFLECACDLPVGGGEFHLLQSVWKECGRCGLHPRQMGAPQ